METLFEDKRILVAVKPAGADSEAVAPALYCVHRLDRETEGVMVFAKDKDAASKLSAAFSEGNTGKRYYAVVCGIPEPSGTMEDLLFHDARTNKTFVVDRERKGVKKASLEYETLATVQTDGGPLSLVRIRLRTGRTHQIRIQFGSRKMPLAGDGKYGSPLKCPLALCAYSLSFPHPRTGERLRFTSLPDTEAFPYSLFREAICE